MIFKGNWAVRALDRRQFLKSTVIGFLGTIIVLRTSTVFGAKQKSAQSFSATQSHDTESSEIAKKTTFRFFNNHQQALVSAIGGLIVALDSNQNEFADTIASDIDKWVAQSESKKKNYVTGLKRIDSLSRERYGSEQGFLGLKKAQQLELLDRISKSAELRRRPVHTFWQRVHRKLDTYWDEIFGAGAHSKFFNQIRADAVASYYSNPIGWLEVGYYGPPQPVGYLRYDEPPEFENHTDSIRTVNDSTCLSCHEKGRHSRGGSINLSCTYCHHPHSPWPYEKDRPRLEDQLGIAFPSPDKKKPYPEKNSH